MTGPVPALQKGCQEVPTRPCRPSSLYVSLGMLRAMRLEQAYEQLYSHQTWCGIALPSVHGWSEKSGESRKGK